MYTRHTARALHDEAAAAMEEGGLLCFTRYRAIRQVTDNIRLGIVASAGIESHVIPMMSVIVLIPCHVSLPTDVFISFAFTRL